MLLSLHPVVAAPVAAPLLVNLAAVDAAQVVRMLPHPPAALVVDCGALPCQRTLGVCFLVSQLLVLRQSGATVWLRNASPVLRRCLHTLQLSAVFRLAE